MSHLKFSPKAKALKIIDPALCSSSGFIKISQSFLKPH